MQSISAETAASDRFFIEGPGPKAWIHNYLQPSRTHLDGTPRSAGEELPMIYLVDQEPNSAIRTHFHQVDQFQIVVGGSGAMGNTPLAPITVHYTTAYTGYGPLRAGPEGLQYLTIRNRWDPGHRYLPECKDELPAAGTVKQRQRTTKPRGIQSCQALHALDAPAVCHLIDEPESGANAWMLSLPPLSAAPSFTSDDSDRVIVVCAGNLHGSDANGLHSCHFVPAGETIEVEAGPDGADLLVLQFRTSR
ncbi:MAG: hypothetical protein IBJ12_02645 [Sphingomonadaceae bacterium]|nr:hypothetical protein [Sphingomonadaceae bacterium]